MFTEKMMSRIVFQGFYRVFQVVVDVIQVNCQESPARSGFLEIYSMSNISRPQLIRERSTMPGKVSRIQGMTMNVAGLPSKYTRLKDLAKAPTMHHVYASESDQCSVKLMKSPVMSHRHVKPPLPVLWSTTVLHILPWPPFGSGQMRVNKLVRCHDVVD